MRDPIGALNHQAAYRLREAADQIDKDYYNKWVEMTAMKHIHKAQAFMEAANIVHHSLTSEEE